MSGIPTDVVEVKYALGGEAVYAYCVFVYLDIIRKGKISYRNPMSG
jgi:hypothetical protein